MKASKSFIKEHHLKALHKCIETCFQPLANRTMAGVQYKTCDKIKLKAEIVLAFYVANIQESEDLSSMKRGSQTAFPCH